MSVDALRSPVPAEEVTGTAAGPQAALERGIALRPRRDACVAALEAVTGEFPETPQADCARAMLALMQGDPDRAIPIFERALDVDPMLVHAHLGLAEAQLDAGLLGDAADSLELARHYAPRSLGAHLLLGRLFLQFGDPAQAVKPLETACALQPSAADAWYALGVARARSADAPAAAEAYRRALALDPTDVAARVNLGLLELRELDDPVAAERSLRAALAADPGQVAAWVNLGLALLDQGRVDDALALYRHALERFPGDVDLRWHRGIALLAAGCFDQGWQDYALRDHRGGARGPRSLPFPAWQGEPLDGVRLLVHAEQGLGDEIMFATCVPDLIERGARVVLECDRRLGALFARAFAQVEVVPVDRSRARGWPDHLPRADFQIAAGSLPGRFRRSADAFAGRGAYLRADIGLVRTARAWLDRLGPLPRIGIVWRGGTRVTRGHLRSLPVEALAALGRSGAAGLVALQHGITADERAVLEQLGVAVAPASTDLDAHAAMLMALDAVITIDCTTAHLAGALGLDALVLLGHGPEWRWLARGERAVWYPSLALLRRGQDESWQALLARAVELARGRASRGANNRGRSVSGPGCVPEPMR